MSLAFNYQVPTKEEAEKAAQSRRQLVALLGKGEDAELRLYDGDKELQVPIRAIHFLVEILDAMSQGEAISIVPINKELTTQEAANLLNVSRPYLVQLLEQGQLPYHKVGVRRKVLLKDLMDYKKKRDEESKQLLDELAAEAQNLDMGY
ncbi:helix-turn-helix domain-containing protein [Thiofilum flexile]|uniref:helix-turn-helix domain-containing protein n=1 Tax=Thiofilum flexile TaxID=125627 RepID=UPI00036B9231|nr:helix-turn-helix domain-containing protein [Thiofilum flexile]